MGPKCHERGRISAKAPLAFCGRFIQGMITLNATDLRLRGLRASTLDVSQPCLRMCSESPDTHIHKRGRISAKTLLAAPIAPSMTPGDPRFIQGMVCGYLGAKGTCGGKARL